MPGDPLPSLPSILHIDATNASTLEVLVVLLPPFGTLELADVEVAVAGGAGTAPGPRRRTRAAEAEVAEDVDYVAAGEQEEQAG